MKTSLLTILCLMFWAGICLAQVDTVWTKHFDYTGGDDIPCGLAVDDSGNCYVAGQAFSGFYAAATIKYKPNGDTAWVRVYQESGGSDELFALAVDASRNVYVTGRGTPNMFTSYSYLTIKYRPDGSQAWLRNYSGRPGSNYYDAAYGVAVDGSGNVYVTGESDTSEAQNNNDLVTVKYSPAGDTLWTRRYDADGGNDVGLAVAVDGAGNVFAAGASQQAGVLNPILLKYSPSGVLLWQRRYPVPVDITFYNYVGYHPVSLCLDAGGFAYLAANTDTGRASDYLTIKYNPNGDTAWARTHDRAGYGDAPNALTCDSRGNVYVTGFCSRGVAGAQRDFGTLKYDANGNLRWAVYSGQPTQSDRGNSLAVDSLGNVFVAGFSSYGRTNLGDFTTIKYDSSGVQEWTVGYNGAYSGLDIAYGIALDNSGNILVTGQSYERSDADFTTIKYRERPSGVEGNSKVNGQESEVRTKATPNPFASFATVPGHERDNFSLYDISGRMVGSYCGDRVGEGLAPGVYFLRPERGDARPVRIVKLR